MDNLHLERMRILESQVPDDGWVKFEGMSDTGQCRWPINEDHTCGKPVSARDGVTKFYCKAHVQGGPQTRARNEEV